MFYVNAARLGITFHLHSFIVGARGASGIGAMGVVGDEYKMAMSLSVALMEGLDQHQAGKFAMGASRRLKGDARHAGDFGQVLFNFIEQLNGTLNGSFRLQGVNMGEAWQGSHIFIQLGIILHGTGAKRVEASIHAEVALREMGVVAYHLDLAYFR